MERLQAVDYSVNVPLDAAGAFELFTRELHRWWPLSTHSCTGENAREVRFDPRVGGQVVEIAVDGAQHVWGTLLEWNPPAALAMTWHPGLPPQEATRLRVTFTVKGDSTDVRILHDGWEARGDAAEARRAGYAQGWPIVMGHFVAAARG